LFCLEKKKEKKRREKIKKKKNIPLGNWVNGLSEILDS